MSRYDGGNIYNINLICVVKLLNEFTRKMKFCQCEICMDNMCALTLAKLPPNYATNPLDKTTQLAEVDEDHVKHLMVSIIRKVSDTPHH